MLMVGVVVVVVLMVVVVVSPLSKSAKRIEGLAPPPKRAECSLLPSASASTSASASASEDFHSIAGRPLGRREREQCSNRADTVAGVQLLLLYISVSVVE